MDPPLRVFVAIATPEPVRHELQRVQRELAPLAPPGVIRWIMPEQFHLTLKFLGNVPAERAAALKETLRPACSEHPALRLRAQGVGFFPNAASPRVIWAGVNDSAGQLLRFQGRIEAAL
ncbi:MAG: RNA 2',3'-cyclic phosphodiesterase, partial [Verrucomicrobia bacterium]|nr:RNA 2',3'-cyclic phosphodiesterase [Verrucomicrobiota bacterium]